MSAEMLLHYLWEHRLWKYGTLRTVEGQRVEVLDPGIHNDDSGPDFFNAKIIIGEKTWAGNVEIHTSASDWFRHGHQDDPAYQSIILHVVGHSDAEIKRPDGSVIPQLILPYTADFRRRYLSMVESPAEPACASELHTLDPLYVTDWLTALAYERIYAKVDRVFQYLRRVNDDWQAAAYITLARALGFSTNAEPFERLAVATPLRFMLKHSSQPALIEAILFGQSGFLDAKPSAPDDVLYIEQLRIDYDFLRAKYGLSPLESPGWKLARMRPPNFPHRRIAALCSMISDGFTFGRKFSHVSSLDEARQLFNCQINGYWESHFSFGGNAAKAPRAFSPETVGSLIINALVPLLYAYGLHFGNDRKMNTAIEIMQALGAEHNSLTRIFTDRGISCDDAFTSQALIQLRRAYCEPRKCLFCRIGHRILAAKSHP